MKQLSCLPTKPFSMALPVYQMVGVISSFTNLIANDCEQRFGSLLCSFCGNRLSYKSLGYSFLNKNDVSHFPVKFTE